MLSLQEALLFGAATLGTALAETTTTTEEYRRNPQEPPDFPSSSEAATKTGGHQPGGLPMISDSAFSLVILVYVSVAFCFVFFMFCWKSESSNPQKKGLQRQCVLMANSQSAGTALDTSGDSHSARALCLGLEEMNNPVVIPPTPTPPKSMSKLSEEDEDELDELDDEETSPV